jgi:hypothetical protein
VRFTNKERPGQTWSFVVSEGDLNRLNARENKIAGSI